MPRELILSNIIMLMSLMCNLILIFQLPFEKILAAVKPIHCLILFCFTNISPYLAIISKSLPEQRELDDQKHYLGKLNYLSNVMLYCIPTRLVSLFMSAQLICHWDVVLRVLSYIKSAP